MRVRQLLLGSTLLVGAIAALTALLLWRFDRELERMTEHRAATSGLLQEMTAMRFLLSEHVIFYEDRSRSQWAEITASLADQVAVLAAGPDAHPGEPELLGVIQRGVGRLGRLFSGLEANHRRLLRGEIETETGLELEKRLRSQGLIASQDLYAAVFKLDQLHAAAAAVFLRRSLLEFLVLIVLVTVLNGGTFAAVNRRLRAPLARLGAGARILGGGDLSHRIALRSRDELGDLARAFDEMASRLQASLQELEGNRHNLEERVAERTAEVEGTNARLQAEIRERERVEAQLRRTLLDLKRSNKELEQYAYLTSHDLQEPLRTITGFLQLIERRYRGRLDADADEFIAFAVKGAQRMQEMIQGLLAYSRIGTRGAPFEPCDGNSLLSQALDDLQRLLEEAGAVVTHDPLPTVAADRFQLTQLFQNLIANAVKFRGPEAPRIHVGAQQRAGEWLFAVRDNGIGFAPEYAEKIFEIFKRLHTMKQYPGSGIGLAICRRIVERHGGRIWAESEPGKGATFYFTLPRE